MIVIEMIQLGTDWICEVEGMGNSRMTAVSCSTLLHFFLLHARVPYKAQVGQPLSASNRNNYKIKRMLLIYYGKSRDELLIC